MCMFADPVKIIDQLFVAEGMTVVDFGAGTGFYTIPLARKVGPYGKVFAIDVHAEHLAKIKNESVGLGMKNVEVIMGDLEMPRGSGLLPATVDRIVLANVLFQADNPQAIAFEAKRILKHSGKVVVVDWIDSFSQMGPHKDHVVTEELARAIFESNGFTLESTIDAGSHHYGLLYVHESTQSPGAEKNMHHRPKNEINPALVLPPQENNY